MSASFIVGAAFWLFVIIPLGVAALGWLVMAVTAPFRRGR